MSSSATTTTTTMPENTTAKNKEDPLSDAEQSGGAGGGGGGSGGLMYYSSEDDSGSLNDAYFMRSDSGLSPAGARFFYPSGGISPLLYPPPDAATPLTYSPTSPEPRHPNESKFARFKLMQEDPLGAVIGGGASGFDQYDDDAEGQFSTTAAAVTGNVPPIHLWMNHTTTTTTTMSSADQQQQLHGLARSSQNPPPPPLGSYGSIALPSDRSLSTISSQDSSPLHYFRKSDIRGSINEDFPQGDETNNNNNEKKNSETMNLLQQQQHYRFTNSKATGGGARFILVGGSPNSTGSAKSLPRSKQDRRKQRQHRFQQRSREHWVRHIRGKPQFDDGEWKDVFFLVMFLVQFIAVIVCAIRFGGDVVHPEGEGQAATTRNDDWTDWSRFADQMDVQGGDGEAAGATWSDFFGPGHGGDDDDLLVNFIHGTKGTHLGELEEIQNFTIDYRTVLELCGVTGTYATILSILTVGFMLIIAKSLIQTALVFSILLSLAWGVIGTAVSGNPAAPVPALGFVAVIGMLVYTIMVWDRCPFAGTNLYISICAMRCTVDITLLGIGMILVAFAWSILWTVAFVGVVDNLDGSGRWLLYIMMAGSFLWTNMVIKNVVKTTVANVIGTWWFQPESISPCCTPSLRIALIRSLTKSLGSICLGSLVVFPVQIINVISNVLCLPQLSSQESQSERGAKLPVPKRQRQISTGSSDGSIASEISTAAPVSASSLPTNQCCMVINEVPTFLRACNRWSFSYIGLYGYSFVDSGHKAIELFEAREWVSVVNDNLISNVLFIASLVIAGSTGTFAVLVEEVDGYTFSSFHKPIFTAFLIGSTFGFVLSSILLSGVIGSAVNTIMVCFAAGPFEFHKNHPRLSHEMREVWSQQVWEPTS